MIFRLGRNCSPLLRGGLGMAQAYHFGVRSGKRDIVGDESGKPLNR